MHIIWDMSFSVLSILIAIALLIIDRLMGYNTNPFIIGFIGFFLAECWLGKRESRL